MERVHSDFPGSLGDGALGAIRLILEVLGPFILTRYTTP